MFQSVRREAGNRIPQTECRTFRPAPCPYARHTAIIEPNIKCEADFLRAVTDEPLVDLVGTFNRCAANDHATDTLLQQIVNGRRASYPTTNLQPHSPLRSESDNDRAVGKRTILCPVQIHHVQPGRPETTISEQQLMRLQLIASFGCEIALEEPDGAAVAKVN